jgi:hypothetical protein
MSHHREKSKIDERGSTAQIITALITIGQHFFQNCNCSTPKIATGQIFEPSYVQHIN